MYRDEIYEKVIESTRDIKYMREDITEMKNEMKTNFVAYSNRLSRVEEMQNLNAGKISVIMIGLGAIVVSIVQLVMWSWDKIAK